MPSDLDASTESPAWASKVRPVGRITAVNLVMAPDGKFSIRSVCQLESDAILSVGGPGFNDLTIRVRGGAEQYLVFRQDVQPVTQPE